MAKINGIELRNWKAEENATFDKRVKGDIYKDGECIGAYDPMKEFVRIEKEGIKEEYAEYTSLFSYDRDKKGIEELLKDLEIIIQVQDFVGKMENAVGIVNGTNIKAIIIKDAGVKDKLAVKRFIKDKVQSIVIDEQYPFWAFINEEDYDIDLRYVQG